MVINLIKIVCYFGFGYVFSQKWGLDGFCAGYVISEGAAFFIQSQLIQAFIPREVFKYERFVLLVILCAIPVVAYTMQ